MQSFAESSIKKMLIDAYTALGVQDKERMEQYVRLAQYYLSHDREHYIELAEGDIPEYLITVNHGKICKLVPLAQRLVKDRYKEHAREKKAVLALMVGKNELGYVYIHTSVSLHDDPDENNFITPLYRYADLQNLIEDLQVASPQSIRPISTAFEWDCYCVAFAAFMKLCKERTENVIPHKTERAMLLHKYLKKEKICLEKETIECKLLPLAHSGCSKETMHADHRHKEFKELCLLTTQKEIVYALRITHVYQYFTKVGGEDGYFEDTTQKQEIEYKLISWDEIPEDMYPLYY